MTEPMKTEERATELIDGDCSHNNLLNAYECELCIAQNFREAEQAARDDAFEECIQICGGKENFDHDPQDDRGFDLGTDACVSAIRARKEEGR